MKKLDLYYSVCQYIPDDIREERINVGVVVHCPNKGFEYSEFRKIKNRARLYSFDDEYDKEYIDMMFEHLEYQFNFSELGKEDIYEIDNEEFNRINEDSFLLEKTKYYVNEFRFLPIKKLEVTSTSIDKDIKDLERTYLYYDKPKSDRITTSKVKSLLNKEVRNLKLKKYMYNDKMIKDFADENIFEYEYGNTCIKTFSFDYASESFVVKEIKNFLFDLKLNKKYLENKEIIIVVNQNFKESSQYTEKYYNMIKEFENLNIQFKPLQEYATELLKHGVN